MHSNEQADTILTVTPNTALDQILFIDRWTTGVPMRTDRVVTSVGGKGLDSSVALYHLGVDTVGLGFFAGRIGRQLIEVMERYGIQADPVWVEGETRLSYVISELGVGRHNHVIAGVLKVRQHHVKELFHRFREHLDQAVGVICAGSLPPQVPIDLYKNLVQIAAERDIPVLVDSQMECMVEALDARPFIVKMNWNEFEKTTGQKAPTFEVLKREARRFYDQKQLSSLVVTLGEKGMLAVTSGGVFHAVPPKQKAINAAGAGDAVSSAIIWRLTQGDPWTEALSWAAATAAAVVLTEGTADCDLDVIKEIRKQVEVFRE